MNGVMTVFWIGALLASIPALIAGLVNGDVVMIRWALAALVVSIATLIGLDDDHF